VKVNNRKVKKFKGGGMDASQADFGGNTPGPGDTGGEGGYSQKSTNQFGGVGSSPTSTGGPNQVQARTGPVQVPTIGPLTYAFNKISKSLYNKKNLEEQKKEDVLGGEMLTTGKRTTPTMTRDGGDGGQRKDPMILPQVAVKPTVPIPLQKVTPRKFAFELKRGGLSGGVKSGPPPKRGPNPQGMKKGGMVCPHRPDGIRGQGAAIKGFKFTGVK